MDYDIPRQNRPSYWDSLDRSRIHPPQKVWARNLQRKHSVNSKWLLMAFLSFSSFYYVGIYISVTHAYQLAHTRVHKDLLYNQPGRHICPRASWVYNPHIEHMHMDQRTSLGSILM